MSGDLYGHIHLKMGRNLFPYIGSLSEVLADVVEAGEAEDLANEIGTMISLMTTMSQKWDQISEVVYCLAYWQDGDSSETRFRRSLEAWRAKKGIREGPEGTLTEALQAIRPECPGAQNLIDELVKGEES